MSRSGKGEPKTREKWEMIKGAAKEEQSPAAPSTQMLKHRVEPPGGCEDWTLSHNAEPLHQAVKGWFLPRDHIQGTGITYTVRYMGCVEVMQSMRSLDFNTRTQVTREAISRVCEAVPGAKGAMRKRKPPSKGLSTVLGKSNLQFAGMNITLNISTSSLNLMIPDSKQIIANHHMQSISFASGGDPDTTDYVAYVAKDPVNQRACHILECSDSIAQDVINTIGQAFELRFKQYLKNPSAFNPHNNRIPGFSGPVWNEQNEEDQDLDYSNEIPGKQPPSGGLQARRIKEDSAAYKNSSQLQWVEGFKQTPCESVYENCTDQHKQTLIMAGSLWNRFPQSNANILPIKATSRSDLFDDPCYMNTQTVEKTDFTGKNITAVQASANTYREHIEVAPNNATINCPTNAPLPTSPSSMKEQLVKEIWYHGRMSRQEAERLLLNDGDFLVRESMTTTGQYVLTGLQGGQAKHLLLVDPEGMVRTKDHIFDSVNHLISYHVDNHLPIISPGHELFLKKTIKSKQQL
eukprot:gi/632938308/ref/XP_007904520.1/ PREDICTED: SHC-transforming protein 4 isoform X2 [Callorhinchus milii]